MIENQDFITKARRKTQAFWDAYHDLKAMQDQWNALDYGTVLSPGAGENAGILASDVGSVLFSTMNEVDTRIFQTAHKTNLAKLLVT